VPATWQDGGPPHAASTESSESVESV
jgi:hypothetical protein